MSPTPGGDSPVESEASPEGPTGALAETKAEGQPLESRAGASTAISGDGRPGPIEADVVVPAGDLTVSEVADSVPEQGDSYDIESTRANLAIAFVVIFAVTIFAAIMIVALTGDHPAKEVSELLPTLLPAETALLGSAVGFYFGAKER